MAPYNPEEDLFKLQEEGGMYVQGSSKLSNGELKEDWFRTGHRDSPYGEYVNFRSGEYTPTINLEDDRSYETWRDKSTPLMEEVVVTGKRGGMRADPRYYVPEISEDRIGIDTTNVAGQIKSSLWDIFSSSMKEYLSGNKFSQDTLTNILKQQSLRVPIKLPGDYGVDIDINRPMPHGGPRDTGRITLKKEF